jgi:hypothetical protein
MRRKRSSGVGLLNIGCDLLNLVWVFIPHEFLSSRCCCQYFVGFDPSCKLQEEIWKILQKDALFAFRSPRVVSILKTDLEPYGHLSEPVHPRESQKFLIMISNISSRISAAFQMEYHLVGLHCIAKFDYVNRNKLFRLLALAMTHTWEKSVHVEVPVLSHDEHCLLSNVIFLRTQKKQMKCLEFNKQDLTVEDVVLWSRPKFGWTDITMKKCGILDTHVKIIVLGNPMLRDLDLSENKIGDDSVDMLVQTISKTPDFRLTLSNHVLSPKSEEKMYIAGKGKHRSGAMNIRL